MGVGIDSEIEHLHDCQRCQQSSAESNPVDEIDACAVVAQRVCDRGQLRVTSLGDGLSNLCPTERGSDRFESANTGISPIR